MFPIAYHSSESPAEIGLSALLMSEAPPFPVVILGAGGDAAVVAESLACDPRWQLVGFLDDRLERGTQLRELPVLGPLDSWSTLPPETLFIAALHKVKQMQSRASRIESLGIPRQRWATIVDRSARIAADARLGCGTYVGPNVVVQPGVRIGDQVSIRAGANLGHDAEVGNFCYLGPNTTLCGNAAMETGSHLGPNSCIADGQRLGAFAVVGISSAVTKFLPEFGIYFGVPASRVGTTKP